MIEYIGGGADYLGLDNLNKIKCPDCNRGYLHRSKFNPSEVICDECALKINEADLNRETKIIPTFGQYSKPFLNQINANRKLQDESEGRAFVAYTSDAEKLNSFSLDGIAKARTGGVPIDSPNKEVTQKTIEAIKPITDALQGGGKELKKVDLA